MASFLKKPRWTAVLPIGASGFPGDRNVAGHHPIKELEAVFKPAMGHRNVPENSSTSKTQLPQHGGMGTPQNPRDGTARDTAPKGSGYSARLTKMALGEPHQEFTGGSQDVQQTP